MGLSHDTTKADNTCLGSTDEGAQERMTLRHLVEILCAGPRGASLFQRAAAHGGDSPRPAQRTTGACR